MRIQKGVRIFSIRTATAKKANFRVCRKSALYYNIPCIKKAAHHGSPYKYTVFMWTSLNPRMIFTEIILTYASSSKSAFPFVTVA